jgi:hypothetical protein
MRLKTRLLLIAVGSVCAAPAWSQSSLHCDRSYGLRVDTAGNQGTTLCASKATTFFDSVDNFQLNNNQYTETSQAQILGRFSDVNIVMNYAQNSNTLNYNFVELGESGSFTGANRDASEDQFTDFVKKSDIIGRLMKYQAANSATSPIAGVGGMIPMAGAADFAGSFDTLSKIGPSGVQTAGSSNNLIGVGLSYGSYNVDGSGDKVSTTSLPLSYTIRNDIDPRRQLVFNLPLTKVSVGDAASYHGGLGVSYRVPLSDHWTLTPGGKYSIVASKDRATVSTVMSASLMSTYAIPMDHFDIAIGNMVGIYKTGKFRSGDYSFDPDIKLTMTRNGVMLSSTPGFLGGKLAAEYSFIDTRYLGNKPFVSNTQEFGITVGTNKNASNARTYTRAGASYIRGKGTHGFTLNLGYWF